MSYTSFSTRVNPQTEPIPGQQMISNNAWGFVYALDNWKQFERFLITGTEGGTYYVNPKQLTKQNGINAIKCISEDGPRAIKLIVDISESGRAPHNDPAIFGLALAAASGEVRTRRAALEALPRVCRIPTHLFHFVTFVKQFRGFGRGLKTGLANWYLNMDVQQLAYEMVKYQGRDGWTNRDVLRLSHPKTSEVERSRLFDWIVRGVGKDTPTSELPQIVQGFEEAKKCTGENPRELVGLIHKYNLSREMVPTEGLKYPEVWEALLVKMPMTAMIRNLATMTRIGLIGPMSDASNLIASRLRSNEGIKRARIHPIHVLIAMRTYAVGRSEKSDKTWKADPHIMAALDDAFYLTFDNLTPTNKRTLIAVDMSGSMLGSRFKSGTIPDLPGLNISPAEAAAAMAMALAKKESQYYIMGFASTFRDLGITNRMLLNDVVSRTQASTFGRTDCSLPMQWAVANNVKVDAFMVLTDNETYAGSIHPSQALKQYREKTGIAAKEVVLGMTSTGFTIADPKDPLAMDVCGFDSSTPSVISDFVRE